MAIFSDYQVVVSQLTYFDASSPANFAVAYANQGGRPGLLDFQAFGGFRPDPADPTGQTGLPYMDLQVFFDGRLATVVTIHRWTEHLEIIPDRPLVAIPTNRVSHVLLQPAPVTGAADYLFVGPVALLSRASL